MKRLLRRLREFGAQLGSLLRRVLAVMGHGRLCIDRNRRNVLALGPGHLAGASLACESRAKAESCRRFR